MEIKVKAVADKRIFCLYAALNATVYDKENAEAMHSLRLKVRDYLNSRDLLLGELKQLFAKYPEEFYYRFRHWILSHGNPPEFKEINNFWKCNSLRDLDRFKELLRDFWNQSQIEKLWQEFSIEYKSAIKEAQKNGEIAVKQVTDYLNIENLNIEKLIIIPNLLDSYNIGLGPTVNKTAYAILGPSQNGFSVPRIEHELLHSIINPLTEDFNKQKRSKLREYIIRAIVLRLNKDNQRYYKESKQKLIDKEYIYIDDFLNNLEIFEKSKQPFNKYFKHWLLNIQLD